MDLHQLWNLRVLELWDWCKLQIMQSYAMRQWAVKLTWTRGQVGLVNAMHIRSAKLNRFELKTLKSNWLAIFSWNRLRGTFYWKLCGIATWYWNLYWNPFWNLHLETSIEYKCPTPPQTLIWQRPQAFSCWGTNENCKIKSTGQSI